MVEVLDIKPVTHLRAPCKAELCVQTNWVTDGNRINTPFGVYSGIRTSDPKDVAAYKKQGLKFSEKKYYFVRIMDRKDKCVKLFDTYKKLSPAEKQFTKLKK